MDCYFCEFLRLGRFAGRNYKAISMLRIIMSKIEASEIKHGTKLIVQYSRLGKPTFNKDVILTAKITAIVLKELDIIFDEYYPIVFTMMPKSNKNLIEFLKSLITTGFIYNGDNGYGLQFSINTLNEDDRNKMFRNKSLSLQEIGNIIDQLPYPRKNKYILDFAHVTSKTNLDVNLMNKYFNKDKCIIKITPIRKSIQLVQRCDKSIYEFDMYELFEKPLINDGLEVIIPSKEEDKITCGDIR